MRASSAATALIINSPIAAERGEEPAAIEALCRGLVRPYVEAIAENPLSADPEGLNRLWAVQDRGIWFLEDVGGPEAEEALYRIGTGADERTVKAAAAVTRGNSVSVTDLQMLEMQSDALASLYRLNPVKGREAIAKALAQGTLAIYDPFLPADRLPAPYALRCNPRGADPQYGVYQRQRALISTPELTERAGDIALAVGYGRNGAWEYLRLVSPDIARQTMEKLLTIALPDERKMTGVPSELDPQWKVERPGEVVYERYYQFEMLKEAVHDGLLSSRLLAGLSLDEGDGDRLFWGAYGDAKKGDADGRSFLQEQAETAPRQWKYLAMAGLASLGDFDAKQMLVAAITDGTTVERTYAAHAVTALYGGCVDDDTRDFFRETIEALSHDASFVVGRYILDRSYWLPPDFAAHLVGGSMLKAQYLLWTRRETPTGLAPLLGVGEGEPRSVSHYYSDVLLGPSDDLVRTGMRGLPVWRRLMFTGSGVDNASLGEEWFYNIFGWSQVAPPGWRDVKRGTPEDRAFALACLARMGDEKAADELSAMMDGGLDVPAALAIHAAYPSMLSHLGRIVTGLAEDKSDPGLLNEAARSYLLALRRSREKAAALEVPVSSTDATLGK